MDDELSGYMCHTNRNVDRWRIHLWIIIMIQPLFKDSFREQDTWFYVRSIWYHKAEGSTPPPGKAYGWFCCCRCSSGLLLRVWHHVQQKSDFKTMRPVAEIFYSILDDRSRKLPLVQKCVHHQPLFPDGSDNMVVPKHEIRFSTKSDTLNFLLHWILRFMLYQPI